jgi:hypothetical protein
MFFVVKGAHMTRLATPVHEDSSCPNVVVQSYAEIRGDTTKSIRRLNKEVWPESARTKVASLASVVAGL